MNRTIKEQILMEMEEKLSKKLEKIMDNHPTVRPGLLYRNNIDSYATFKDRKREYGRRRGYYS